MNELAARLPTFGLTTFRDDHLAVDGARMRIRLTGKCNKRHDVAFADP